jgi:aspartokinase
MLVMKFGGTSVGDVTRFDSVSQIIQDAKGKDEQVVVVVSAMSGVTNSLVKAARAAAEGDEVTQRRIGEELLPQPDGAPRADSTCTGRHLFRRRETISPYLGRSPPHPGH